MLPERREQHADACDHLFQCGAGDGSFSIGYDGTFRVCGALRRPDAQVGVRPGAPGAVSLREAWERVVPRVRDLRAADPEYLSRCRVCPIINLCLWCPAHALLETGCLDAPVEFFCAVAHARATALTGGAADPRQGAAGSCR